jgi:serine/threonine protein kinase
MLKQQLRQTIKWNLKRNPSNHLKDIALRILEPDPYERIKTNELVKHKWIRDELKIIQVIKSKESMIRTKQKLNDTQIH